MKLDRNTNRGGRGKYALVSMRKLIPIMDMTARSSEEDEVIEAFERLVREGIISLGNETPGDQFFVMKYKDKFTGSGLQAYAIAASGEAERTKDAELQEYAAKLFLESHQAYKLGNRIPD